MILGVQEFCVCLYQGRVKGRVTLGEIQPMLILSDMKAMPGLLCKLSIMIVLLACSPCNNTLPFGIHQIRPTHKN